MWFHHPTASGAGTSFAPRRDEQPPFDQQWPDGVCRPGPRADPSHETKVCRATRIQLQAVGDCGIAAVLVGSVLDTGFGPSTTQWDRRARQSIAQPACQLCKLLSASSVSPTLQLLTARTAVSTADCASTDSAPGDRRHSPGRGQFHRSRRTDCAGTRRAPAQLIPVRGHLIRQGLPTPTASSERVLGQLGQSVGGCHLQVCLSQNTPPLSQQGPQLKQQGLKCWIMDTAFQWRLLARRFCVQLPRRKAHCKSALQLRRCTLECKRSRHAHTLVTPHTNGGCAGSS